MTRDSGDSAPLGLAVSKRLLMCVENMKNRSGQDGISPMKLLFLSVALFGLLTAGAFGQSFGNITVTGTASVNELDVSGPFDIQGNSAILGSWTGDSSEPGVSFSYSDGRSGINASFSEALTRPGAGWGWLRLNGTNPIAAMTLSGSNQLILTGVQSSNPGSIVIDPTRGPNHGKWAGDDE